MARSSTASFVLAALLTSASVASGCSGCDKPADNAVDAAPSTSATPAAGATAVVATDGAAPDGGATAAAVEPGARRGMHRGPSTMLFGAARGLGLPAEQLKKVDDAEKLSAAADGAKEAAKELHTELVAGIKAGKIDAAKLEPKYAAMEKISATEHDKETASLNALYAALDAAQRKAVVTSLRAKQAKRDANREDAGSPDGGKPSGGKRSFERLVRGIDLDADQQKKVESLASKDNGKGADPAETRKRVEGLLTAFEKDGFDAKKADAFDAKRNRAALEEETKLLSQVLPILKPEQREKLAAKMERGPSSHMPKRAGFGHRPLVESEDDDFAP